MMRRVRTAGNSTSAVLWLMIMLVFLPIAAAHAVARYAVDPETRAGAAQQETGAPRAG